MHVRCIVEVWSMTEDRGMCETWTKDLEPSPSAKMAWLSNFTIAVFSLYSMLASC